MVSANMRFRHHTQVEWVTENFRSFLPLISLLPVNSSIFEIYIYIYIVPFFVVGKIKSLWLMSEGSRLIILFWFEKFSTNQKRRGLLLRVCNLWILISDRRAVSGFANVLIAFGLFPNELRDKCTTVAVRFMGVSKFFFLSPGLI